jgi:predicted aspartyl protease
VILGQVNSNTEAIIPVTIQAAAGQTFTLDAMIDTGFSGYLSLPIAIIAALRLTF